MLNKLKEISYKKISSASLAFKRYIHTLDMNDKLIGILGQRGVGKTTFLLQYLKLSPLPYDKKLYLSMDHFYMADVALYEIVELFEKEGGELVVIDEIHKYPNFERELKSIYDTFDIRVIFSGSSALSLENSKADLSRRAVLHRVKGLSFREFLAFELSSEFESYTLDDILHNHTDIADAILQKIKPYEHFKKYLNYGYYPFYKQNLNFFSQKLLETINIVIESDMPIIFNIESANIFKLKKLLALLCKSKPYELNISKLAQKIEINRNTLYHYLHYLEMAGIILLIKQKGKGDSILVKPEKLYLNNTNIHFAYCQNSDTGTTREAFFVNQLYHDHAISYSKQGDFLVDDTYTFEIGGKNKSFKQIAEMPNSYVVSDDIEIGFGNKIPLWLFGFLY